MVLFFVSLALFPNNTSEQNKISGLWFTEYENVKSIHLFQKIESTEYNGQLIAFDNNGGFVSYSFKTQKGKILFEDNSKQESISFDNDNIMYYTPNGTKMAIVLKRINNRDHFNKILAFINRNEDLFMNKEITDNERERLGKEIKKSVFWEKLSMSPGKYLGWLKKRQRKEWEKTINESKEKKNFSANFIVDTQSQELIIGKWLFNGKHRFIFTNTLVCETLGVKLYRLKMENRPDYKDYDMTYTILIHKDDNRSYLHLVYWQFEFQRPSRIEFKNNDKLITLLNDEIDGEAIRIK